MDFSQLASQLLTDNPNKRSAALSALSDASDLAQLPPEIIHGLLMCLSDHTKAVQRGAAQQLVRFAPQQPEIIDAVQEKLSDADARLRWTAAYTLSQLPLPEPSPLPVLIENLAHQESDLRWAAATAILKLARQHASVLAEMRTLASTGNAVQRRMALYCLRDSTQRDKSAQQVYLTSLTDADSGVRLASLSCLGKLKCALVEAEPQLVHLLGHDPDIGVRRATAVTLGQLGIASSLVQEALTKASQGDDRSLSKAAAGALKKML
jgi:hypothetical protein